MINEEILKFILQTEGSSDVAALAKTLFDVGLSGTEAASKAQALLAEIARLAENSQTPSGLPARRETIHTLLLFGRHSWKAQPAVSRQRDEA